jgi:signal transduction histidine kinase/ActR/RegA family two-component response regulator
MYNKIQFKIIALITLVTAFFILGLLSLRNSETRNISMLLKDRVSEKDTIIRKVIELKSKTLLTYVYDYSYWDEMLEFLKTKDDKWAYENIIASLSTFNINAVWIYNTDYNLAYTTNNIDERTFKELPLSKEDLKSIVSRNLFSHFFINTNAGLMEISVAPLQPGYDLTRVTKPQGYYIGGRLWTDVYIKDLSALTSSQISLISNIKDSIINNNIKSFEFVNEIYLTDWNGANFIKLRAKTESPVIEKFFNYSLYQFIGITFFIVLIIVLISMYLFKIVNKPLKSIANSLESSNIEHIEYLFNNKDEFGDISRLISDSFKYKESLLEEIAMRKNAEKELRKAIEKAEELSKLKSNLLANLSHEFRTPLSGIIGISELLKDEINNNEQFKLLNDISISGKRLHDTLNSVLLLAQFESSDIVIHKENFNLAEEIKLYFEKFKYKAEEKKLELKIEIEDNSLYLDTDKDLLKQILYNLLDNAVKFTDKGSINIKLSSIQENNNLMAVIEVSDTGIGISENNIKIIFDEFRQVSEGFTRKYEGTGLGLTLTKKVLDLLNGKIICKSKPGMGSTFTVNLPAYKIAKGLKETISTTTQEKLKLLNILLVEDNTSNQFVFKKFLENIVKVDIASDGQIALELIKNNMYDIIFMDINLGLGMDGIKTTNEIKKIDAYKNIPVAALTGYAMEHDRDYFLKNGFDFFIIKPYTKNDLVAVINRIKQTEV